MRIAVLLTTLALAGIQPVAFADSHCACTKECMEACQKGNSKGCTCKTCDCAKTGKCSEDHCKTEVKK